MQSHFRRSMAFLVTAVIILSSCSSKTNKEGRYIPNTAGFAITINGESLAAKLPWEEIKQNDLFKEMYADTSMDAYVKSALDNPDNTGIDTKKTLILFAVKDSSGGYVALEGMVKDEAKFKQFNTSVTKAAATEKDGVHYLTNNKLTASWDKDKFVIVINAPEMNDKNKMGGTPSNRNTASIAGSIYTLSEGNSLAKDEKFSDLITSKGDVHFWMNVGALNAGSPRDFSLAMLNLNKLSDGSFFTGVANFENGRIDMDIKSYSGKEMTDINKKYSDTKLNMEMIKRIPSKDLAVLATFSFKPEGLRELIKLTGLEGLINIGASQMGFTFDDFIKANKGDILLAVSDIRKDTAGRTTANALFTTSIGDKASFAKLIEAGNKIMNKTQTTGMTPPLFYNSSDAYFALGTDKLSVDKYLSTSSNSSYDFTDKISGGSSAFYLNFKALMAGLSSASMDSLDKVSFDATISTWDNIIATGRNFKDGATPMHIEFNLLDKNTNSLKQLNKYMGTLGSIAKQKKSKQDKWMTDAMKDEDANEIKADTAH